MEDEDEVEEAEDDGECLTVGGLITICLLRYRIARTVLIPPQSSVNWRCCREHCRMANVLRRARKIPNARLMIESAERLEWSWRSCSEKVWFPCGIGIE